MLTGINPLLTGELLWHLDTMGHGDLILISDAHFPALRGTSHQLVQPGTPAPELIRAVRTVLAVDSPIGGYVMAGPAEADGTISDLRQASQMPPNALVSLAREEFYSLAETAFLTVRTAEIRPYGNIVLRKGLTG